MRICLLAILVALSGCAALPTFMQPKTEETSEAEGAWLGLDTLDTLQTVQIAKHPKCWREADPLAAAIYGTDHPSVGKVIGVNLVLMAAHTMVASWLDEEVAKHDRLNDGNVGPWYVGRFVFHAVSLVGTGLSVAENRMNHIEPWSPGC